MCTVFYLNALKDNYIWCVEENADFWVIDPGDAKPVLNFLSHQNLNFQGILVTHHHLDHTGGVLALKAQFPQLKIYAPEKENITGTTHPLKGGEIFPFNAHLEIKAWAAPGHTRGHLIYTINNKLFSGDCLFGAGCGRLFEGTAAEMFGVLNEILNWDESTLIYPAHEYTLQNLRFAQKVEPKNEAIQKRMEHLKNNPVSVPFSLKTEKMTNLFLRFKENALRQTLLDWGKIAPHATDLEVFTALRTWRNEC